MISRLKLQRELEEILGSQNVYFQPPESIKINYPAIVYSRDRIKNDFANNGVYGQGDNYEIITLDSDPDSILPRKVSQMDTARHLKNYTGNNLNYDVFSLTYNKK